MDILQSIEALQQELVGIEQRLADANTPADQVILDDEWLVCTTRLNEMCELYWNAVEDTRSCERCAGCANCAESSPGYDGADEI